MRRLFLTALLLWSAAPAFAWGGAPDWVRALVHAPLPSYPSETRGVVLLDQKTIVVTDAGDIRTHYRRATRILNTAGRELGFANVLFDDETRLSGFRAWSITPSGEEYEVKDRDSVQGSAGFEGELYGSYKVHVLRIPAAEPGSIVAFEYEQRERPHSLQASWRFQQDIPVHDAQFSVSLPAGWSHEERWFNASPHPPVVAGNQLTWEVRDIPAIIEEPGRPSITAIAGRMSMNFIPAQDDLKGKSHRSWNDVASWYAALIAPRRVSSADIKARAAMLTSSLSSPWEKIRALATFAQREVRYAAIEIGIGGYQPHLADDVLRNRYGDCKDKVALLAALLREIGVDSYFVLAATDRGVIDPQFASLDGFNHVVIAIPVMDSKKVPALIEHPRLGRLLIFDPTSEDTPFGSLPTYLQDNDALIVEPTAGTLVRLPAHSPEASQLRRTAKLTWRKDDVVEGEVTEVRTGAMATQLRSALRSLNDHQRLQFIEHSVSLSLAKFDVANLTIENVEDASKDLLVRYKVTAPQYAKHAGNLVLLRPRILGQKAERLLDLKDRTHAYETAGPALQTDDIEISVPEGIAPDELPAPVNVKSAAIAYWSQVSYEKPLLRYKRRYVVQQITVPVAGLAELNRAFTEILADERASVVFRAGQ